MNDVLIGELKILRCLSFALNGKCGEDSKTCPQKITEDRLFERQKTKEMEAIQAFQHQFFETDTGTMCNYCRGLFSFVENWPERLVVSSNPENSGWCSDCPCVFAKEKPIEFPPGVAVLRVEERIEEILNELEGVK